ncbi:MAG: biopolymer transporter ExbD [Pseudomonadota bacterium]
MRRQRPRKRGEPTIALINIVFLMLVFFMVAGTLAPPMDGSITLVDTSDLEGREPAYALVLRADGTLRYRGADVAGPEAYLSEQGTAVARIMPDRNAPAAELLQLSRSLREAGAERIVIVTEKAAP